MKQCEIEDLYDSKVRSVVIGGKTFNKNDKYNTKTEYGKHEFSLYIIRNYEKIDFSNFKPILDSINNIC